MKVRVLSNLGEACCSISVSGQLLLKLFHS